MKPKSLLLGTFLLLSFSLLAQDQELSLDSITHRNHFQTAGHVFKTSFNTIPSDFVYLGKEFSDDWKKTGYYAAGILGLIAVDKVTTKAWQKVEENIQYNLPNITPKFIENTSNTWLLGPNAYLTYPIIGMYAGSLFTNNEKGQFVAMNSFKAVAYSTLITQLTLKTIFGRKRPHEPVGSGISPYPHTSSEFTSNNWDFFNSREGVYLKGGPWGSSLPSMHVTTYFAIAKVLQMEFDNYWVPYGLMAVVFASNIDGHRHWVSDMVAGGLVGTLIGRSVVRSSWRARGILGKKKEKKMAINYIPRFSSEFTGLRVVATF